LLDKRGASAHLYAKGRHRVNFKSKEKGKRNRSASSRVPRKTIGHCRREKSGWSSANRGKKNRGNNITREGFPEKKGVPLRRKRKKGKMLLLKEGRPD